MNDDGTSSRATPAALAAVRPLLGVRQIRQFTDEPLSDEQLDALTDVARWSGSSRNEQPWHFIVVRERTAIKSIAEAGLPQTRSLQSAAAAIAIVLPVDPTLEVSRAYDDGRVAERILIGASLLGIGAGIAWIRTDVRSAVADVLGLPADRFVRTMMSLGHPSAEARRQRLAPGTARRPRAELVLRERWSHDPVAGDQPA